MDWCKQHLKLGWLYHKAGGNHFFGNKRFQIVVKYLYERGGGMRKDIKSVDLVFENVEYLELPKKYIRYLKLDGIHKKIAGIQHGCFAEKVIIHIAGAPFDAARHGKGMWSPYQTEETLPVYARVLEFSDITSLTVKYKDGSEKDIYVDYPGSLCDNVWQQNRVCKDGSLVVMIGQDMKLEDYAPAESFIDKADQLKLKNAIYVAQYGTGCPEEFDNDDWDEYNE